MPIVLPAIPALGTTWLVELFDEVTSEKADETNGLIRLFLSDFESKYSRFNPDSLISTLNRTKTLAHPDPITLTILRLGQQFYSDTGGVFNCLVGEHLVARGYDADYSFAPKAEPTDFPNPLSDLSITDTEITLKKGLIDLGGYGKGYLIDRLAELLHEHDFHYFLINGGGDMYATSDHSEPITIYLEHSTAPGTYIAKTTLKDQDFAASSTHKRRWKVSGKEYSHLVDTKADSTGLRDHHPDDSGIYVKAPTAVLADTWSTTLLLSDPTIHHDTLNRAAVHFAHFTTKDNSLKTSPYFLT